MIINEFGRRNDEGYCNHFWKRDDREIIDCYGKLHAFSNVCSRQSVILAALWRREAMAGRGLSSFEGVEIEVVRATSLELTGDIKLVQRVEERCGSPLCKTQIPKHKFIVDRHGEVYFVRSSEPHGRWDVPWWEDQRIVRKWAAAAVASADLSRFANKVVTVGERISVELCSDIELVKRVEKKWTERREQQREAQMQKWLEESVYPGSEEAST